ncbi:MAG: single-stranded-DNA-specific exonuclease RecJ [Roseiflexaceae bacterium]
MSARKKRWEIKDPAPAAFVNANPTLNPIVATLLYQRGHQTPAAVEAFLSNDYRRGLHDPFLLSGMDVATKRVAEAIQNQEPIAVYGDFDTDGVTAVTLLTQAIGAMGGDIRPYIPHRLREGYGLNTEAIDQLVNEGTRLLLTVDCGISNVREVAYARAKGLDVIVTDHHTPPEQLPDAMALINPKLPHCTYPYKGLVGVGIAYKLVQALVRLGLKMPLRGRDLLDVVALGTVADMGPLDGENRILVKVGLEALNTSQRPGIQALITAAGLVQGRITASDIGFGLGPRLNASGRLDHAVTSYKLLLAENAGSAKILAQELNATNIERQKLTKEVQALALAQAQTQGKDANRIVVIAGEEFPSGVVGLVAARLVEEFARPVVLIEQGAEISRGSARSIPGFNIVEALHACKDLFSRYGGHASAAGFSIETRRIGELEQALLRYAATRLPDQPDPVLAIDTEAELSSLNWELLAQLSTLEPFGQANPQPVLISRKVRVLHADTRGAEKQHLRLRLDDGRGGSPFEAIAFRLGHLAGYFERHPWLDIAYHLEVNEWNGQRTLQLNIKDLRRAAS